MAGKHDNNPRYWTAWDELRQQRTEVRGISLRALAARSGYSPTHISDLEKGRREPTDEVYRRLAKALRVPRYVLIKGIEQCATRDAA